MEAGMRRWTINGRFLSQPMTGVQRYGHEVVRALDLLLGSDPGLARDLRIELLVPPGAPAPDLRAIPVRRVGALRGHLWEQAVLGRHAPGGLLSLCNTGPVRHPRHIVCIHDLNARTCPESYSPAFRALYRVLMPALGRSALAVATVSGYSAAELERHGICPADKILLAHDGHEHVRRWQPAHSEATRRVASPNTIVVIGSPARHKNSGLIVGLADRLAEAGLRVAVVGAADPRVFNGSGSGRGSASAELLGRVGDGELAALLRDSMCLAFPSLVEGFGLPPLEAMALGCPVVSSDRASLPEICGDAALYADPEDADAWFDRFIALRNKPALRRELAAKGRAQSSRFRWSETARRYLQAMAAVDGVPHDAGHDEAWLAEAV
jgi:glycosyltransferase involved in cell wall biosynthesis